MFVDSVRSRIFQDTGLSLQIVGIVEMTYKVIQGHW